MSANALRSGVLLVHHDPEVRARLEILLGEMGYLFIAVPDADAMWKSFSALTPDIVIVGWDTPGIDAMDLCSRIRDRADGLCFVMVIADGTSEFGVSLALAAGADDYVEQPIRANQFRARLEIAERQLRVAKGRRMAESEAVRLRWLAEIGQSSLTLPHEINNPLTALYGLLETVFMAADLPIALAADIQESLDQAKRIAGIVRRVATERHRFPEPLASYSTPRSLVRAGTTYTTPGIRT
jgi:DNA-binding response OmpR family regulator